LWHDSYVLVILIIAGLAVLACVVTVSLGYGGELADFPPDVPPLDLPDAARVTAADLVAVQLPVGLVGYHTEIVDEVLQRVSSALSARDDRIAVLEQRVAELLADRLQARQEAYARPAEPPRIEHLPEVPTGAPTGAGWDSDMEETW
jgi:hypothetical protein